MAEEDTIEEYYITGSFGGEGGEQLVKDEIADYQEAKRIMKRTSNDYPFVKLYRHHPNKLLSGEINQELLRAGKSLKK